MSGVVNFPSRKVSQYRWVKRFAWWPTYMGWGLAEQAYGQIVWLWPYYELETFGITGWHGMPNGPAYVLYPHSLD